MAQVIIRGPVFDGRAGRSAADFCRELEYVVGWQAHAEGRQIMDASFRNPTPYYEVQTTVERTSQGMVFHDRGIVYGPWLEGVSQRNQASRFKGYHAFRRATLAVFRLVPALVAHTIPPFLRRMQ